ncbi:MAG: hypothetical protein WC718_06355 [Phycisphaerales bacterium]|jgi:hypothetical protein
MSMVQHSVISSRRLSIAALVAVLLGALGLAVGMAPEPDPIPRRWQLAIEPGEMRVASVEVPGVGTRAYYFMTYKVTNTSDTDLLFTPTFDMLTDDGDLIRSGRDVPLDVTKEILQRVDNSFVQDQISIVGSLLQGEANAKEGLVIWPVISTKSAEFTVFAGGFSGETRPVETVNPADHSQMKVLLRKTLMMRFQGPGELRNMEGRTIPMIDRTWVMR